MYTPPPFHSDPILEKIRLADWMEINLLLEEETKVSKTDVIDELVQIPPDSAKDSENRFEYEDSLMADDDSLRTGFWEVEEDKVDDIFRELIWRETWLGSYYPIAIDGEVAMLNQEMIAREVYQFLIMLRARQLYNESLCDDGWEAGFLFEELTKHALGAYIGSDPCFRVRFGVAGGYRGDGLPPRLDDAVRELGARMHEMAGEIPNRRDGDYGVDALAWKPFGDKLPGQNIVLGQATITEGDWVNREPPKRWTDRQPPERRLLRFLAPPLTAVAFPETLSLTSTTTLVGLSFSGIPLDRLRLLSVLRDEDLPCDLRHRMCGWVDELKEKLPILHPS